MVSFRVPRVFQCRVTDEHYERFPVQSHLLTVDGDALRAGKYKRSAVFLFSLSACSSIRIFQREMSDAPYACFMHVHCNGHYEASSSAITRAVEKKMHPYFWLPVYKTFGCFHVFIVLVSTLFLSVSHICYTIGLHKMLLPKKGKIFKELYRFSGN